jgi:hypothetical protein
MLKLFNEFYYIDLDEIEKVVNLELIPSSGGTTEQQIRFVKYDIVKMLIEVLVTEKDDDVDETLGPNSAVSIPFKIAFNTLLNNKIIKKY